MKRYLVLIAATSLILGGCGKSEEPATEQAGAKPAAETAMESTQPAETMAEPGAEAAVTEEAAAPEAAAETAAEMTEAPAAEAAPAAGADAAMGQQAYKQICFACHDQGVAGAPKIGDKAAWEPRIAQGMDTLVNHAINGFQGSAGVMPPKGGMPTLSDEQVAAAVAYIVGQAQ